ncbi:MAG: phage tail assembly chaperone [Asticcacaulis sp.]
MDSWAAQFRHAVLGLGLTPQSFWALSWREWQMLAATPEPEQMDRRGLEDLMREFPDE